MKPALCQIATICAKELLFYLCLSVRVCLAAHREEGLLSKEEI